MIFCRSGCKPCNKNVLWIVADVVIVTAAVGGIWCHWLNAVPTVNIPASPPPPSPNGYDSLVRASDSIADAETVSYAGSNGKRLPDSRKGRPYSTAELEHTLALNRGALVAARESLALPYQNPFQATHLTRFRQVARLFDIEGKVSEARGDIGGAVRARLDAMQMGADQIPRGGELTPYLVGISCEAVGRRPLWTLANRLSAADARAAARRLQEIDDRRVSYADALTAEKWTQQRMLLTAFRGYTAFGVSLGYYDSVGETSNEVLNMMGQSAPSAQERLRARAAFVWECRSLLTHSKTRILRDQAAYMDALVAQDRQPYSPATPEPPLPGDTLNDTLLPVYGSGRYNALEARMQARLLAVVMALRAYRVEHGDYPASLDDLVKGGYLAHMPSDPYAGSLAAPFRYRRLSRDKYLLYSVGPDGKDDGGRPAQRRGEPARWTEKGMTGDFVVGVNTCSTYSG